MLRLAALLMILAHPAWSGAWPRDRGQWFVATSVELRGYAVADKVQDLSYYSSFYLEHGLTDRLTVGLNAGHGTSADTDVRAFLRMPVLSSGSRKLALELSVGKIDHKAYTGVGLQYGRGFEIAGRPAWFSVEGRVEHVVGQELAMDSKRQGKFDVTLGMTHANDVKSMVQVFNTEIDGTIYPTLATGLVVPLGGEFSLESGLLFDLIDGGRPGLKFGLWKAF